MRIGIDGAYFAVRFGNEDAQGQLQSEGGVFDHQRRTGFGRAEDDDFCRLHGQSVMSCRFLMVDDGKNVHPFAFYGSFKAADGFVKTVF